VAAAYAALGAAMLLAGFVFGDDLPGWSESLPDHDRQRRSGRGHRDRDAATGLCRRWVYWRRQTRALTVCRRGLHAAGVCIVQIGVATHRWRMPRSRRATFTACATAEASEAGTALPF